MTDKRIRYGMVGGGPGAFIGAIHRMAARLEGRYELVAGAFSSNRERGRATGAQLGLAQLEPQMRAKVEVVPGTAGASCHAGDGSQVIIVDPPRKGLDPDLTQYLAGHPPEMLIYISCGLSSFIKDVAGLLGGGQLRLSDLTAFNLMPFTDHVETVATFQRITC